MTLGYILSRYPLLSETFILREMWEVERQGHTVNVYALRVVAGSKRHPRAARLRARVVVPGWVNLRAHAHWLRRRPRAYLATLAAALWHNRQDLNLWLGAVAYWGKAVAIAARLEADGVERLHAHYATHPALVAYVAHRLTGVSFSFTVHAHDIFCHQAMLPQKLAAAERVVAISRYNRTHLLATVPAAEREAVQGKIAVVHCGVEVMPLAAAARALPAAAVRPLRLLAVGSLQAYKGHRHLIEACALLQQAGQRWECRIIGGGPLQAGLSTQIHRLGLASAAGGGVHLAGPADEDEVRAALAWADVFVMPSIVMPRTGQMEGIPVALMEAMAAGRAVVASRISGIPELIEDGVEGLLVPPGDAGALAAAAARLQDAGLRQRLGVAARRRVEQEFELSTSVTQLLAVWGATHEVAA